MRKREYSETFEIIHSRCVITLLAIYKIPKLKYVFARCAIRYTPVDLTKVYYLESFAIYSFDIVFLGIYYTIDEIYIKTLTLIIKFIQAIFFVKKSRNYT